MMLSPFFLGSDQTSWIQIFAKFFGDLIIMKDNSILEANELDQVGEWATDRIIANLADTEFKDVHCSESIIVKQ